MWSNSATRMAKHSQQQRGAAANAPQSGSGASQAVVELCEISASSLIFWSRRHFEVGAEMQVRIHHFALPAATHSEALM
jgi:hypothetical protein